MFPVVNLVPHHSKNILCDRAKVDALPEVVSREGSLIIHVDLKSFLQHRRLVEVALQFR